MAQVLVSHEGSHSADDWAMATASEIFNTEYIEGVRKLEAEHAKLGIATALSPFYQSVMDTERANLNSDPNYCDKPHDADILAHQAVDVIARDAKEHPWAGKLNSDEWKHHATVTLIHHMQSAQHVERLWHADTNPDNQSATAYKARFAG